VTPARRPSPYGPADHALAAVWLAGCCVVLALAALAAAARLAAGVALLAVWLLWHAPRLALDALAPAGGRDERG
jgi:hypothetical protein